jgi:hypothetical protein
LLPAFSWGAATDVARNAGTEEGAGFISWRWREQDHCQFWQLVSAFFRLL